MYTVGRPGAPSGPTREDRAPVIRARMTARWSCVYAISVADSGGAVGETRVRLRACDEGRAYRSAYARTTNRSGQPPRRLAERRGRRGGKGMHPRDDPAHGSGQCRRGLPLAQEGARGHQVD